MKRLILIVSIIGLFCGNYGISLYFYPDRPETIDNHYYCRFNIYAIIIFLYALFTQTKVDLKYEKFAGLGCYLMFAFCGSDIFDRVTRNYEFNAIDFLMIFVALLLGYKKYFPVTFNKTLCSIGLSKFQKNG